MVKSQDITIIAIIIVCAVCGKEKMGRGSVWMIIEHAKKKSQMNQPQINFCRYCICLNLKKLWNRFEFILWLRS